MPVCKHIWEERMDEEFYTIDRVCTVCGQVQVRPMHAIGIDGGWVNTEDAHLYERVNKFYEWRSKHERV